MEVVDECLVRSKKEGQHSQALKTSNNMSVEWNHNKFFGSDAKKDEN